MSDALEPKNSFLLDTKKKILDPYKKSKFIHELDAKLKKDVVGQEEPINALLDGLNKITSGIRNQEKPILTLLFLGPTGVGKTETVKVLAEKLFGKRTSFLRINCEELSESHTVSKLLGSPPGYIGGDIDPLLSQDHVDKSCKQAHKFKRGIFSENGIIIKGIDPEKEKYLSIILFDEIEKAHPKIWNMLLGVLDDGHIILSNNKEVNLRNSIIIMTSNVGSKEINQTIQNNVLGFDVGEKKDCNDSQIKLKAIETAKDFFPPEFCNRFDHIITFNSLKEKDLMLILDNHIEKFQHELIMNLTPIKLQCKKSFLEFVLNAGTCQQYGARHLDRVIQKYIVNPIARMVSSEQLIGGDILTITLNRESPKYIREERTLEQIKCWITMLETSKKKPETKTKTIIKKRKNKNEANS